ncbi:MAG: glycosyltransferase [Vicinamibacteria bacterium]|nr:glycosyltransferase [Vicinamibacteria bacterium]
MPSVSVVVPVKDGAAHLPALIAAVAAQEVAGDAELIALDSGSQDGSRALLAAARGVPVRVLDVAPGEFDHGATRNRGAREASGEFVAFLSQDALPVGPRYLEALLAPLRRDPRLAGATARQVPRPDCDPVARARLAASPVAEDSARVTFATPGELDALPPLERLRRCTFDDVGSAVRREVLLAHPFPETRFGEDVAWADRVLRAGFGLAHAPAAEVVHSHPRRARALFRRRYLEHRALAELFELDTVPDVARLARAALGAGLRDVALSWRGGASFADCLLAVPRAAAEVMGQYAGPRDARRGRPWPEWA